MAKKTRTELSTLAINTNLPDNTTELITPTTERAQLTDERESVVNYKDDLGGTGNAGKFLTVAVDGESLTMVDEPSGVPAWVTFATGLSNLMKLLSGTNNAQIQFFYDDAGVDTLGARISFDGTSKTLLIGSDFYTAQLSISNQFNFIQGGFVKLRIETTGDLTHNADIMALNAQQAFGSSPLYTFKFQGKVTGPSGGSYTFEEFANIKGGKENATENDKAGYLSFTTGIADGTLTERLRITSGGNVGIGTDDPSSNLEVFNSTAPRISLAYAGGTGNGGAIDFNLQTPTPIAAPLTAQIKAIDDAAYRLHLAFYTKTSATASSGLTERVRITTDGVLQAKYGISFPNQSAGSGTVSSSTLDAYEEGTWTPSFGGATFSVSASLYASYTRIGREVTIYLRFINGTISSGSGATTISGLPYNCNLNVYGVVSLSYANSLPNPSSGYVEKNTSTIYMQDGTGSTAANWVNGTNNRSIILKATYFV